MIRINLKEPKIYLPGMTITFGSEDYPRAEFDMVDIGGVLYGTREVREKK